MTDQTLVIVFLRGGADGLTLVPPIGDDHYHRMRPSIRVRPDDAIDLDGYFGLHRALEPLHRYVAGGQLAIVHGAGSEDRTRSHFEAQDFMEHAGHTGGGWLGRYLRSGGGAPGALSAVAIGTVQPESLRGSPAGAVLESVRDVSIGGDDPRLLERLAALYDVSESVSPGPDAPPDLARLRASARSTIDAVRRLRDLRESAERPRHGAVYPEGSFGRGLREIARLIRADLGMRVTTIDMVGGGLGWDTHFVQGAAIGSLMRELAGGLHAFWTDLGPDRSRVTVAVMTEFGRRVPENTSLGTDHGTGGVMMVLDDDPQSVGLAGGAVTCGWSDLADDALVGPGDVPVTTDYRHVLAGVLRRHAPGIALDEVFPGLGATPTA